ncbi:methyltransferase [Corynebacterium diphtheriae]|uniref:O-methyltransferase n=1 Tax=Corynebacterium diphtheriae TaxID=1717 RepID=UPI00086860D0|nr:O-methyltransferase [Corynebacterium diphtheriae]OEH70415.1 methyltransferase [Corynebacterium diphtheriae]OEH72757.1 methyltransferase [Corynebacterium diphtheriae]OLO13627.1 methyltransferase [Corynebacterium diphtheriae]OLO23268.1 methyltransferase [Corynebacterium diphtheriae]OLO24864.1 methyltransferase [Corynebacterium diphtheriae]
MSPPQSPPPRHTLSIVNAPSDFIRNYIDSTTDVSDALATAREDAQEFGLHVPDSITGQLLTTLAGVSRAHGAIAVTPAASVVGLHLLAGLGEKGILTCIDPEPEHQKRAKKAFRDAGYGSSRIRFLPSRPLDVMGRLARGQYQVIFGEVAPLDLRAFIDASLPLLASGGVLVLPGALLDGTVADSTRKDRETVAAREADDYVRNLDQVVVCRLPLGGGTTLITKL